MFNFLKHLFNRATASPATLQPENQFAVSLTDREVVCQRSDGLTERVVWEDLRRVEILTTADGPISPDTFWVLSDSHSGCMIPWGASGEQELLERLQRLPQFDNTALINASSLTEEAMTLCWEKAT